MKRLLRSLAAGFLFGLIFCIALGAMRGVREGWGTLRFSDPPTPEIAFYLAVSFLQSCFAWILLGRGPTAPIDKDFR